MQPKRLLIAPCANDRKIPDDLKKQIRNNKNYIEIYKLLKILKLNNYFAGGPLHAGLPFIFLNILPDSKNIFFLSWDT